MFTGTRPDITPAQAVGLLAGALPLLSGIGQALGILRPSRHPDVERAALGAGAGLAATLFFADAAIRVGRNFADGRRDAAALSTLGEPPTLPEEIAAHELELEASALSNADMPVGGGHR